MLHIVKNGIFTERVTGSTPFHPLASYLQKRHFHREGYRLHPFSSSCFTSSKTAFSPRGLPAQPLFLLLFHIFKNGIFLERVTGSTPFPPLVSHLQKRHIHREGYRLHPFSSSCFTSSKAAFSPRGLPVPPLLSSCFTSSKTAFSPRGLPAPPLSLLFFSHLQKRHFHREGYRLHPFSTSCFTSSKTAYSPRGLPAPSLFILLFHIFKNGIFTERVTGSTPFHPLVSYLQKRHFHREGYRLHPFSSSCFISSKTAFSPRGLPAPPLFTLLFHIFKNGIFTERVTGSTPFHPLASYLQKRHFHREGYRLHPFSSSCFISSKTAFSPRGLPAPPLFILLLHIFKNGIFTERVTGSTPFHPLASYLQKRHFHQEGYRLPFSTSCFTSSKTAFSPRGLPAPPLFILFFHIFKNGIFTERVTGSTPFHPLVSHLQKRHFHQEGYRLHPFSTSCFTSSKTAFSPRGLPAPPLFILLLHIFKNGIFTERVTGSTPFHPLVSHLQKRHFHREGYRLHPFSTSCFTSSKTAFSPRGLPAPPLFILLFRICKNGTFIERVTGSTPFHPLVSHLQKRHFHREGYRLHPFSSSCFTSSKTAFSPRGLPAPPLFIPLLHIFKNGIFTERVTGSTPFPPLVSHFQKRHFHREGNRLHPFSSSCFISSKTAFSPRGLPAPPLFILLFHIFKNGIFTERVTGSTPFHPLVSHLQKLHFHREGYQLHPFSSSGFISSKTAFSRRGLPAPPLFILLLHISKNGIFTKRATGSTPFPPLVSHLQKRHFHRKGYRLHPFSSSFFISSKTAFSPRGLPAPPLFILLFHIFKNGIFTERVTRSTRFHPLAQYLQKRHFHREGYRLHPFSSSCFASAKTAYSSRGLPAPPLFILFFHIFKNGIFTERVAGSTPFHPLVSHLQKRHFHREGYRLHPFSSPCFTSSKTAFSPRGLPAPPLFIPLLHIFKNGIFTERVTGSTPFPPLVSHF